MTDRNLAQSQNYFKSVEYVEGLIEKTGLQPGDFVVEIGPGKGVITRALLNKVARACPDGEAGRVTAVELDPVLYDNLRQEFAGEISEGKLELLKADFLDWPLPSKPYKVFANIPFNTTADIVKYLTRDIMRAPEDCYLVVQGQAAKRFITSDSKNKLLAIHLSINFDIRIVTGIARSKFTPTPGVPIVLVRILKRDKSLIPEDQLQLFKDFVTYGFSAWKPSVRDAYAKIFTKQQLDKVEKGKGINLGCKPQGLTLASWTSLFGTFENFVLDDKQRLVIGSEKRRLEQERRLSKSHQTRTKSFKS